MVEAQSFHAFHMRDHLLSIEDQLEAATLSFTMYVRPVSICCIHALCEYSKALTKSEKAEYTATLTSNRERKESALLEFMSLEAEERSPVFPIRTWETNAPILEVEFFRAGCTGNVTRE